MIAAGLLGRAESRTTGGGQAVAQHRAVHAVADRGIVPRCFGAAPIRVAVLGLRFHLR